MKHMTDKYDDPDRIPTDEPVFLLRGQDALAPLVVRYWANMLTKRGGGLQLARRARAWADHMENWPVTKLPDDGDDNGNDDADTDD